MRRRLFILALFCLCYFPAQSSAESPGVEFGQPKVQSLGTPVQPGDVYGTADFELKSIGGMPITDALTGLMNSIIENRFGNNDGSYLLTIELLRNGKSIVQRPVISVTYTNKKFLFINWSTKVSRGATFKGSLVETEAIDNSNNDVEVALRSYYKSNSTFDLSIFDAIDEVNKNLNVISKLDAIGISSGLLTSVRDILMKATQKADETEDLFKYSMSFAQLGNKGDRARILDIPIRFVSHNGSGQLGLHVRTWSVSSKFLFDPIQKKYIDPISSVYINNTSVDAASLHVPIFDFLKKNGDENIRSFLGDLTSKGYSGDIYTRCSELLTAYHKYLSNRDALALLWATINEHRFDFKRSRGAECVEGRKGEFDALGLPTDALVAYLKSQ